MAIYIDASLSFEFWIENGSPGIRARRFHQAMPKKKAAEERNWRPPKRKKRRAEKGLGAEERITRGGEKKICWFSTWAATENSWDTRSPAEKRLQKRGKDG
jgi:hypothetical protein